jgi:hypothetical protein
MRFVFSTGADVKNLSLGLILALAAALGVSVVAQSHQEPSSSVPALDAFHEVIMPMWHQLYPGKDYAGLRKISKDVEAGVAKIAAAKLPGMLHEKEAAWAKGLAELKTAAADYTRAAAGSDDSALLAAAENLHTAYEAQVRIIRPVVPEMDAFHKTLYVVQHTYVPEKNWAAVCKASGELQAKAEALSKATLPKRVAAKAGEFKQLSASLVGDAKALASACAANQGVEKATDTLHSRYESLSHIFE